MVYLFGIKCAADRSVGISNSGAGQYRGAVIHSDTLDHRGFLPLERTMAKKRRIRSITPVGKKCTRLWRHVFNVPEFAWHVENVPPQHREFVPCRGNILPSEGQRVLVALFASWLLFFSFVGSAKAGVIAAGASAFPLDVNLTITPPIGPTIPITTFGPVFFASTSGPAGTSSKSLLSFSIPPFVSVSALSANATTSFVPLGPGSASADASIGKMSFSIPLLKTSFSSTLIESTANSFENVSGAVGRNATTTISNAKLTILGKTVSLLPTLKPAANTTVFSGGGVTVVLNDQRPVPPFPDEFVEAVDITFLGASFLGIGINGFITIAESETSLTVIPPPPPPAPEPSSLVLLGTGFAGLIGYGWRRRNQAAA